jgi:hypothetical protein
MVLTAAIRSTAEQNGKHGENGKTGDAEVGEDETGSESTGKKKKSKKSKGPFTHL